jgi:cytochrome c-type biogenesis protein CcmH
MRRLLITLFALGFTLSISGTMAADSPDKLSDPGLEARAVALQKELRCVVCQGQSLDESSAPLAADLRKLIREHIANGDSDAQIKNYLVARYGDFILMKPPLETDTFLLWFGPLIVLVMGGAGVGVVIVRARTRMRQAA